MKSVVRYALILLPLVGASWQFGQEVIFKDEVKLVEIYVTVFDHKGQELNDLRKEQFEIRDEGRVRPIQVFEPVQGTLSCALLLDTTGSMRNVMPSVRNGARRLIDSFRPNDLVGIYSFSEELLALQDLTTDRAASKRALAEIHAGGRTALLDSLTQLAIEMERKPGKKVIIVLTDGGDNTSVLDPFAAAARIKNAGVPVFVVAEGDALINDKPAALLRDIADTTGGEMYMAHHSKDVENVFDELGRRVRTGYLLAFSPPSGKTSKSWHEIQVLVNNVDTQVRVKARAGYSLQ